MSTRADTQYAPQLILASASPRRRELLASIGVRPLVVSADIDEAARPGEAPSEYVVRVTLAKLHAVLTRSGLPAHLPVLAADTVVTIDGELLGKPADRAAALSMLAQLSGRTHEVLTAVAVGHGATVLHAVSATLVSFRRITPAEAEKYWATGEPRDKAGAYGIQGIGGIFAERIEGSFTGVMGLPIAVVEELLRQMGVATWDNR